MTVLGNSGRLSDRLLAGAMGAYEGIVSSTEPGVAAGVGATLESLPAELAGRVEPLARDGDRLDRGTALLAVRGDAALLSLAEDHVLGPLGFACGVATNAARFIAAAPPGLRVVCGGWKKLPSPLKPLLRIGLDAAGVGPRLLPGDFLYVDKNAVTMLGGVREAVLTGRSLEAGPVAVQVQGASEAAAAIAAGCGAIMVDTGDLEDVRQAAAEIRRSGRSDVVLAFGGGVGLEHLAAAKAAGAAVVDVGRGILSAPLLDLRFEVKRA